MWRTRLKDAERIPTQPRGLAVSGAEGSSHQVPKSSQTERNGILNFAQLIDHVSELSAQDYND